MQELLGNIRSRQIDGVNGLNMHILEAGENAPERPCLLLLHGFPELAFSWRKIMEPLADAGFYVVAPDQRGYGRTTGWSDAYDQDLASFEVLSLVRDSLVLLNKLRRSNVAAVIGHDFGSPVAAHCALVRPDVFKSVALMSAPYGGPPALDGPDRNDSTLDDLAALARPRKHYQWYYSTPEANGDMVNCPQGLNAFLRAYFHCKSADWAANKPYRLEGWTAQELAKLPDYYVMELDAGMAETASSMAPTADEAQNCTWLNEDELKFYTGEYARTGFQGGLNWYRCSTGAKQAHDLKLFAGRTIDVPACFIAGAQDWGVYQVPGVFEKMQATACSQFKGAHLIEGAGHWVQQEQPQQVVDALLGFLK